MLDKEKLKKAIATGKVSDKTTLQIFAQNEELQQEIDTKIADLNAKVDEAVRTVKESEVNLPEVLKAIKGKDGESIKGEPGDKGNDGKDYILTETDKKEIAKKIKVPEKVIEKIKVIKEQPIVTNEIKEVAVVENREEIVKKINTGKKDDVKIEAKQVEGLDKKTKDLDFALGVLDKRTQFLINKGNQSTDPTKLPLAGGTMSGNITLGENTSVALDPAGSADGKYTGITVTGIGGATIAFGDLVTLEDDSRWEKVDISVADGETGDARGILGIAVTSSTDGTPITVLLQGIVRADANFPTLTIGAPVYASTVGDIIVAQPTTTDYVIRQVGFAMTADEIFFSPTQTWVTHT